MILVLLYYYPILLYTTGHLPRNEMQPARQVCSGVRPRHGLDDGGRPLGLSIGVGPVHQYI